MNIGQLSLRFVSLPLSDTLKDIDSEQYIKYVTVVNNGLGFYYGNYVKNQ